MILLWIAFSLGLTGSLHCMGMCGPLTIGACNRSLPSKDSLLINIFQYNFGRILIYMTLGVAFGYFSHILLIGGFQKIISIVAGLALILIALSNSNIDTVLTNSIIIKKISTITLNMNSIIYQRFKNPHIVLLGMLNGLLPCGLVYLALAGALTTGSAYSGSIFMLSFGLGTLPLLITTAYFGKSLKNKFPTLYQKVLPTMTAILGVFMIIRGIIINLPLSINFLEALTNPVLCH